MITLWQKLWLPSWPRQSQSQSRGAKTYQKLSRSSFANIMSFRASRETLEFVRVLSMHMGNIILFIANACRAPLCPAPFTPSRSATWSVCQRWNRQKKKEIEMKIRCDFWPLPGSNAYLWQQSMANTWNIHVIQVHTCYTQRNNQDFRT